MEHVEFSAEHIKVPISYIKAHDVAFVSDAIGRRALQWSGSNEPIDRLAAAGLLARGSRPKSRDAVGVRTFVQDGPAARARSWVTDLDIDLRRFVVVRLFGSVSDLIDVLQKADTPCDTPARAIYAERERIQCAVDALGKEADCVRPLLVEVDLACKAIWPDARECAGDVFDDLELPHMHWLGDVANTQSTGWWLGLPDHV